MTDYKEEQTNEIEALESIYPDEFTVLSTEPFHCFKIDISSEDVQDEENEEDGCLTVSLQFTYTPTYPEEAPVYVVTADESLNEEQIERLKELLQEQIEENLGMAMVFALVSATQEFLNERIDDIKRKKLEKQEEEEENKRKAQEERDKILKGTPVTIDSFLYWKERFDKELAEIKSRTLQEGPNKRLTGKELFMEDKNLDTSDMALLDEIDQVEVDESLFQEIGDLDLDEELDLEIES